MAKNVLTITKDNFDATISEGVTLVDFWAEWCGPCKMLVPVIDEVANELAGKAKVGKVNVDSESELAQQFGIMSIPTVIIFKDGKVAEKVTGFRNKPVWVEMVKKYL